MTITKVTLPQETMPNKIQLNSIQQPTSSQTFSVLDFYENKTILITGVTGFIGKVLLEKFLRQCSNVKKIYVLIRPLKSKTTEERLAKIFSSAPFIIHKDKFDKIESINGDITSPDLGLSKENRQRLINEVNVVFHSAASINFTGILDKFIEQNINGVISIMNLCQDCKNIESIVHVSTAYANCHLQEIKEKVYPVVDGVVDIKQYLNDIRQKYGQVDLEEGHEVLAQRPNPYTWSKSIAEWIIDEHYQSLPVIICRPSIVANSNAEPFPGWSDNIGGYSGMSLLMGVGIAQQLIVNKKLKTDIIPVDLVANSLIVCGAYRASNFYSANRKVVNLTTSTVNPITWEEMFNYSIKYEHEFPTIKQVRPNSHNYENSYKTMYDKIRFQMVQLFNHNLFAYLFDVICIILGHKPFMIRLTKRMHKSMFELKYFSLREWYFHYENNIFINNLLSTKERSLFQCNVSKIDWNYYYKSMCLGCRRYLLKDPDSSIEMAKIRQKRLYLAFNILDSLKYILYYWIIQRFLFYFINFDYGLKLLQIIGYHFLFQFGWNFYNIFIDHFLIKKIN